MNNSSDFNAFVRVHKRKLKIKQILKIDFGNDEDIIREC